MLIVCPSCESEFAIDPALLRPNGRKLRCASCREVFFIDGPEDEDGFDEDDPVAASLSRRMRGEETDGPEIATEALASRNVAPAQIPAGKTGPGNVARLRQVAGNILGAFPPDTDPGDAAQSAS